MSPEDWENLEERFSESADAAEDFEHAQSEGFTGTFEEWLRSPDGDSCFDIWRILETEAAHERYLSHFYDGHRL